MRRYGIDLRLHAYAPGGISRYARRLAEHIPALLRPDETVVRFYHRRERSLLLSPAEAYRLWTPPHHRLEGWALGLELLPRRLSLFHATDFIPPRWGAAHLVATIHDLNFLYYPQYLTAEAQRYYNGQIEDAVRRAEALLADSFATREDLRRLLGVSEERVSVVHLAADECFRPLPDAQVVPILRRYGLERGYLLFVGTWEPRKNLKGLIDALALLHARGERRMLVIAGRRGWLCDDLPAYVERRGLRGAVRFLERVPLDALIALYNGAILLALVSFYEGFGLPALEALRCGTPVVAADRASLPEVVGDGGLLVEPESPEAIAEALLRLCRDEVFRAEKREAGLRHAATFSWQRTAAATLEVYRHVVVGDRGSPPVRRGA